MGQELNLECKTSYSSVLVSSDNKLVYLLLDVIPVVSGEDFKRMPSNFGLVIDKSGSMYMSRKLDFVKNAVTYAIDQMGYDDVTTVVVFADRSRVIVPSQIITEKELVKKTIERIDNVDVGGGTNMLKGITTACEEVHKNLSPQRVNHIILLTDGLTLYEDRCLQKCKEETEHGITFSTMGVGNDFNSKLLITIANSTGGKSYYIDEPSDIPNVFAQEIKGVQSVITRNANLQIKFSKDIFARRVFKAKPLISDLGSQYATEREINIKLNDLQKDERQSLLLELVLPAKQEGSYRIAKVSLTYEDPNTGTKTIERDVLVSYTTDTVVSRTINAEVMNLVDLVSVFKQQTRALELAEAGDTAKATQLLKSAATTLLDRGESDLAQTYMDEANRLSEGRAASAAGTKKLEYGTRKLTQMLDDSMIPV